MSHFILFERVGSTAVVTLNRPEKLNALHRPMRAELTECFKTANADPDIRAVVLTGIGERAFCAGEDLAEIHSSLSSPLAIRDLLAETRRFYDCIRGLDKPLVVGLNGMAVGEGFQVILFADSRVGHSGVRLGQVEIKSGIPSVTGSLLMARRIGTSRAVELALTGRLMDASEASNLGLINHVVPADEVRPKAIEVATQMGQLSQTAVRLTKQWFRQCETPDLYAAFDFAEAAQDNALETGDMAAQVANFVRRKNPSKVKDEN